MKESFNEVLPIIAVLAAVIGMAIAVPEGLEREDRRICIQSEGWVRNNGAPPTVVPEWCYEQGFLERK